MSKTAHPFLFMAAIVLIVGLACGLVSPPTQTSPPDAPPPAPPAETQPPAPKATEPPPAPPTEEPPAATEAPTLPPPTEEPQADKFFTDEFDNLDNWDYKLSGSGLHDLATVETQNGRLVFKLKDVDLYTFLYSKNTYDDVRVTVNIQNFGINKSDFTLMCRYDETAGWYSFTISMNGLYNISVRDQILKKSFELVSGATNAMRVGQENEISILCQGQELVLFVNGQEVKRFEDKKYVMRDGMVVLSATTYYVHPIDLALENVEISAP